jgi:ADP-ribose pyrophosphatase
MRLYEKKLSENRIYDGRIIRLHVDDVLLENGNTSKREVIEHPGGVSVAVLTESDEILFVRQFRYPYGKAILELPAGKLEPGEDPFEAVKREQKEETGTTGTDYVYLGDIYPSPGYTSEIIRLWLCRLDSTGSSSPDDDEFLEIEKIEIGEALKMVMSGEIRDAKTQIGILKTAAFLKKL